MKWYQLWKKIGKQPLKITQYNDVKIFINNEEYLLDKIKYESGIPIGLVAMIVKDKSDLDMKKANPTKSLASLDESDYEYEKK